MLRGWKSTLDRRMEGKYWTIILAVIGILAVIILIIVLALTIPSGKESPGAKDAIECPGMADKNDCVKRGCIYKHVKEGPSCYMPPGAFGYTSDEKAPKKGSFRIRLNSKSVHTPYGVSLDGVSFHAVYLTKNILRFKFTSLPERYEVPVQYKFPLLKDSPLEDGSTAAYHLEIHNDTDSFTFQVRRTNGRKLWDTRIGGLLLSEHFLQLASYLPSDRIFGIGENVHESFKHDMHFQTWPLFSADTPPKKVKENLYGVHPFYTCLEEDGKSHGVLLLNSNAMEVTLLPAPAISFRTIGGVLDFFMFVGDNPEHVIQLYTSLIGRPMLPPYWSLGFQLSRYGYDKMENLRAAVERTRKAGIAQDVQFLDIDHMVQNRDFTIDKVAFPDLNGYVQKTKEDYGLRWIIILDPGIPIAKKYTPYSSGLQNSVFIKRGANWSRNMFPDSVRDDDFLYGSVWPREIVAFPDFFLNQTWKWWKEVIVNHHKTIAFDGLWIDMNEPSNFGTNEANPENCDWRQIPRNECWALICPNGTLDDPIYNPVAIRLSHKTLCMSSVQGDKYLHYDVHSLYGWSQTEPTLLAAEEAVGERSLVISRSTYPSSGRYGGHWLGDNESSWKDLRRSIIGMLEFNLFGIPYIGADVCGFFGDTSPELCKRWMQLGAFYPFFRNHNGMLQKEQDPGVFPSDVVEASRAAVERRYRLNPYLYTLFHRAHVDGSTVVRPVHHEFPDGPIIDEQFMWGSALLISPILHEGQSSVKMYLPDDEWWHFCFNKSKKEMKSGEFLTKTDEDGYIPVHVRGGSVIPTESYQLRSGLTPAEKNITLFVFLRKGNARGELFEDDGVSKDSIKTGNYSLYTFQNKNCTLKFTKSATPYTGPKANLKRVVVFNAGKVANISVKVNAEERDLEFSLNEEYGALHITVDLKIENIQQISWKDKNFKCNVLQS